MLRWHVTIVWPELNKLTSVLQASVLGGGGGGASWCARLSVLLPNISQVWKWPNLSENTQNVAKGWPSAQHVAPKNNLYSCMQARVKLSVNEDDVMSIRELKHARFWDADGNRKRTFRVPGKHALSPRFLYYSSLMEKRYLAMRMWLCAAKLTMKIAHFRLPSASQNCACLSSLFTQHTPLNTYSI